MCKKCLFILVAVLCLHGPALANSKAWDKISWGMQPSEVSQILGQMVRTVDMPGRFTHQVDNLYKGYHLAFTFFGKRGLERLGLFDAEPAGLQDRYEMLRETLTLKYGKPITESVSGPVQLREWLDDGKLVQLHYRDGRKPLMTIVYIWRKSSMTEDY